MRQVFPGMWIMLRFVPLWCGVLLLAWGLLGVWHHRQVDRIVHAMNDRGELTSLAQLKPTQPLMDHENALHVWAQAASSINPLTASPLASNLEYEPYPPFDKSWYALAEASYAEHGALFDLARQASAMEKAQNNRNYAAGVWTPLVGTMGLSAARAVANHLADAAMIDHLNGQDAQAMTTLLHIWRLADHVTTGGTEIDLLVATEIRQLAMTELAMMAPRLTVDETTRPQIQAWIDRLLGLDLRPTYIDANQVNRLFVLETDWNARQPYVLRAFSDAQFRATLQAITTRMEKERSIALPMDHGLNMRIASRWPAPTSVDLQQFSPLNDIAEWRTGGSLNWSLSRCTMQCRMTATSLAVRLFRVDMGGWPPSLQELTPDYLSEVPVDGWSPQRGPITLLWPIDNRPVLHSVGANGVRDDYLSMKYVGEGNFGATYAQEAGDDQVIDLTLPLMRSP